MNTLQLRSTRAFAAVGVAAAVAAVKSTTVVVEVPRT